MAVSWIETRDVPIRDLTRFPGNARRGDVEAIRASVRRHGQYRALVVRDTGDQLVILAGNHTRDAIAAEGHESARCEILRCTDDEARRINLADNRLAEMGSYDDELVELLSYLDGDYDGTGWTQEDVDGLVHMPEELPPALGDPDATPAPPASPTTSPGDVWALGPHRICCGDSRDYETVTKLLDGQRINVAFTSPPYASQRAYDETSGFKPVPPDEYVDWFEDVQANVRAHLADDGSWFVNIKEHAEDGQRHLYVKDLTIAHVRRWAWRFVDEFAWTRSGVPGTWPNRFKNGWEPVFHFTSAAAIKFRPQAVGHESDDVFHEGGRVSGTNRTGNVGWHGGDVERVNGVALPSNVIHLHTNPAAMQGADHPAAYPLALPAWFIKAYSDPSDVVFDPFMGSGTTLIAAHQENRVAYGCEISPAYCDVICSRWETATGDKPILAATGEPVSFI